MASTAAASSVQRSFKYDVFLSFRGEDTRRTFVDHLYHALNQRGITTYKDDERIEKGERIDDQLTRSIEESRFYIIVFSKNYASSSWCLDELVKIMECQKMPQHTAYPIFYDVEPTEVRNQSGSVGEAFAKHVEKEAAGRWRDALKEVAGLAGWELMNTLDRHEAKFIQKIVVDISLKQSFISWRVDGDLVGMETRVENIVSTLEIGSEDVRMIGIKGMGGGGKTTLATAVYDRISYWFEGTSFVENVREVSKSSLFGLKELQKQVLSDVLNDQSIVVRSVSDGKDKMIKMLGFKKVLVVLDDVDNVILLEALVGKPSWFKPGSRIIITTRDEQVLIAHGVHSDNIHDVNLLTHEEAICLFSRYAFKRETPNQGYEELSRKVVHYAAGLPLTVKVLGSHLCGRSELEWVDTIERLKTIPLKETLKRLEVSYDGLEDDQKEIFLDVVCILKGERINEAIRVLESCGFNAQIGLKILEQKSLITISHYYGGEYLAIHDHIEEMGRNIVRHLHPYEPSMHSRLWNKKEIKDILVNGLGTEATRSIKLKGADLHQATIMKGLRKMKNLRYLYVHNYDDDDDDDNDDVDDDDDDDDKYLDISHHLPDALRSLYWRYYPFCWLPKTFQANELVKLEMIGSSITELWEGGEKKVLKKLRFLNLSNSKLRTFDLGLTPHLEELNFDGCNEFVELHLRFECSNLKSINLSYTQVSYLNIGLTPHLKELNLNGCYQFVELHLPFECSNLEYINLRGTKVSCLNLGMIPHLKELNLARCNDFIELHLPYKFSNLVSIILSGTKVIYFNIRMTPRLEKLDLEGCSDFVELQLPFECSNLKSINLSYTKVSYLNLAMTPHIRSLDLKNCKSLQEINAPVGCLKNLYFLDLSGCLRFQNFFCISGNNGAGARLSLTAKSFDTCPLHSHNNLPKFQFAFEYEECLPSRSGNVEKLISFGLCACTNLESFSASICGLQHLKELTLKGSIPEALFNDLYQLETLESLVLQIEDIKHIPDGIYMLENLKSLELRSCWCLEKLFENICRLDCLKSLILHNCILVEKLTDELGRLECLQKLDLRGCESLRDIPNSICNMKCLKKLNLFDCILIEKLPEELGCLECLEELELFGCKSIRDIPKSICNMKCLKLLCLSSCILIEKLPEELGCLECLEKLDLTGCKSLRDIPKSICNMKCLKSLCLSGCTLIQKLPEEIGCLECLKYLPIVNAGISRIPRSIYQLKGLCIYGSSEQLESYGFTSLIPEFEDCYSVEL